MKIMPRLRKDSKKIWERMEKHPFIMELCAGTLPPDKFRYYILQDYHFLVAAIKNFNIIAAKAESIEDIIELAEIGPKITVNEYRHYLKLLNDMGLSIEDARCARPIPIVCAYSDFLISVSTMKPFAQALIAILPCFWSYGEIIKPHLQKLEQNRCQLYRNWAGAYTSKKYFNIMDRIIKIAERASAGVRYEELKNLFLKASRYEYMYWEDMYELKGWLI